MTHSLEELGRLVEVVARQHRIKAHAVGVIPTEGNGSYAEVMVDISTSRWRSHRLLIGLQRDAAPQDLSASITTQLNGALAEAPS